MSIIPLCSNFISVSLVFIIYCYIANYHKIQQPKSTRISYITVLVSQESGHRFSGCHWLHFSLTCSSGVSQGCSLIWRLNWRRIHFGSQSHCCGQHSLSFGFWTKCLRLSQAIGWRSPLWSVEYYIGKLTTGNCLPSEWANMKERMFKMSLYNLTSEVTLFFPPIF